MTFNLEDIFDDTFLLELRNKSLFTVEELKTIHKGRCFSILKLQHAPGKWNNEFVLKRNLDLKIFIHQKLEAFKLVMYQLDADMSIFNLEIYSQPSMIVALVRMETKRIIQKAKDDVCKNYENTSQFGCLGDHFLSRLGNLKCKVSGEINIPITGTSFYNK